jgi:predicted neuraminidase
MVTRLILIMAVLAWAGPAYPAEPIPPIYKWDHIYTPKKEGKPHGSSMVELEGGNILATWYASTEETNSEAQIFGAVWDRRKWAWGQPYVIIPRGYSKSVGNTALYKDEDGIIWMFFAAVRVGGWSGSNIDYVQSRDGGKTWSEGKTLVSRLGHLPRNKPIPLGGHRMLAPFFIDFWYETNMVGSYTMRIEYKDGRIISKHTVHLDDYDAIQPALAKLPDGGILLLARDKSSRFIRRSYSRDEGITWAPMMVTDIPNPGSAIATIYVQELGCVLMAYNHSHTASNPLALAFSMDGGVTFTRLPDLAGDDKGGESNYSYPTLLQTREGLIHVLWTHDNRESLKHSIFSLAWLEGKMKAAPGGARTR